MSKIIVAGIINRKTGEIFDTTTTHGNKTAIRLKVRDELGCKHGEGDFMSFEFGAISHLDYYKKSMLNADPNVFRPLRILSAEYYANERRKNLKMAKIELDLAKSVARDCSNLYLNDSDNNKQAYLVGLVSDGVTEAEKKLDECKYYLRSCMDKLNALKKEQIEFENSRTEVSRRA